MNQVSAVQKNYVMYSFITYTLQSVEGFLFATYLKFNSCSGGGSSVHGLKHDSYGVLSTEWHRRSVRWRTDSKLTLDRDCNPTGGNRNPCLCETANKHMYSSRPLVRPPSPTATRHMRPHLLCINYGAGRTSTPSAKATCLIRPS